MKHEELKSVLEALEAVGAEFICRATHHHKKDQHSGLDDCPNQSRHARAIAVVKQALAAQPAQKKPQNCGTGYCSCIECVMKPEPVQDSTCNETLRAQSKAYPRTCRKCGLGPCIGAPKQPPAQPAVPDAFGTREGEHPQYIQGWNDCRAEILKGKA